MSKAMVRIVFAGAFALAALIGALAIECTGGDAPEWLVTVVAAAVGYIFGHVQENNILKK